MHLSGSSPGATSDERRDPMEISATVMRELEEAQAALAATATFAGPPLAAEPAAGESGTFSATGSGTADHVLADHHFTGAARTLWIYAGSGWRHAPLSAADEEGIAQVAFSADRVDGWWSESNKITTLRCWRIFS